MSRKLAIVGIVLAVPAAVVASLQIADRVGVHVDSETRSIERSRHGGVGGIGRGDLQDVLREKEAILPLSIETGKPRHTAAEDLGHA